MSHSLLKISQPVQIMQSCLLLPAAKFPQFPTRLSIPMLPLYTFLIFKFSASCSEKETTCDLNFNNSRNKTDKTSSSSSSSLHSPHPGPLTWSNLLRRTDWGQGFFLLTYFYFNALKNPQTFFFYRHASPVALSLLETRLKQSSTVLGSGFSSAQIIQGFCTSMLSGQRSYSGPTSVVSTAAAATAA